MGFFEKEDSFENQNKKICNIKLSPSLRHKYSELYKRYKENHDTSDDTLKLTKVLISLNESNYTVWSIRRKCLISKMHLFVKEEKKEFLLSELDFIIYYCRECPKSYQVWYHRRWILERIDDVQLAQLEKRRIEFNLEEDPKNFNLWQYRTFLQNIIYLNNPCHSPECDNLFLTKLLNTSKKCCNCLLKEEKEFSNFMISLDHRNNSAWNIRVVTVKNHAQALLQNNLLDKATNELRDDILYYIERLKKTPHNESCWNALRSYFDKEHEILHPTTATCACGNASTCVLCNRVRFKWTDSDYQTMIISLIDHVLEQDSSNRFCLGVQYLLFLSLHDYLKCYQILDKLSNTDYQRKTLWGTKKAMFCDIVWPDGYDEPK